jgi:uncharacterized protein (UPF0333 family)
VKIKYLIAGIAVVAGSIGLAPVASADTCADANAAIAAHNNSKGSIPTSNWGAVEAYNHEADQLDARAAAACHR